jgi:hypothetical protein
MSRSLKPPVEVTSRTTAPPRRSRRSEAGDTLVEVLLALVVLGMASVALLIAFGTSISASAEHRNIAGYNQILATATQEAIAAIDAQPTIFVDACVTPITAYPDYPSAANNFKGFPLPAPYSNIVVTYSTTNPVEWWDGQGYNPATWNSSTSSYPSSSSATPPGPCEDNEPQLITIGFTAGGTYYSNSFVVQYPVTQKNTFSGDATSEQLVLLNYTTVGGGYAGSPMTNQPIYEVEDSDGIAVTTDLSPVVMTLSGGAGVLTGCQGNEVLGVITFTGCSVSAGGTYTLSATDGSLTAVDGLTPTLLLDTASNPFSITNAVYHLVFTTQPQAGASGLLFATFPVVSVETSIGGVDQGWANYVTFTFSGGIVSNCPSYGTFTSTATTVTEIVLPNGTVTLPSTCTFSGGYFFNPNSSPQVTETQYTMTATALPSNPGNAAVPALSSAFSVSSFGTPSKLVFSAQPTGVGNATATTAFTGQPAVTVEDGFGNQVTSATQATNPVTLTITNPPQGETLSGCTPAVANGIYTFSGCAGTIPANGLTLTAASPGLTSATSTAFNITGAASQLLFSTQPVAQNSGSNFASPPVLVYEDASNNVVTAMTSAITLTTSPVPSTAPQGVLSTCTNLVPVLGYVKVANCEFAGIVGNFYTMTAQGGGLTSPASSQFSPTGPGNASQLVWTTEPAAGASTYQLVTQPVISLEDSQGNLASTTDLTINLSTSGGTLANCANLTSDGGVVDVADCTFAGVVNTQYTMTASTLSPVLSATSTQFSPTGPGPLTQIALSGCPSAITTLQSCVERATLEDSYGNAETADSSSLVTFNELTSTGSASGFSSSTDAAGVANDTLTAHNAGAVNLNATADGLTAPTFTMTVNTTPTITPAALPTATQSQIGYTATLASTGGTAPQVWSISSGSLPSGLAINPSTGVISGNVSSTATGGGFTVKLTDADGVYTTLGFSITVNALPNITTTTAATATQKQVGYSQPMTITGGASPFTWSVSSGILPSGLSINASNGTISGTVGSGAVSENFTVQAVDANGVSDTQALTITVNAAPTISPTSLPGATLTGSYHQQLSTTGGTTPFGNWTISPGTLPAGLSINSVSGLITGTPTGSGSTFTASITDNNGVVATQQFTIAVNAVPTITTPSLNTATDNQTTYSQQLTSSGGTSPYTWSLSSGTLPTGLTLSSSGLITGSPVTGSTQNVTVKITDANGVSTTAAYTLTVYAAPAITTPSLNTATDNQTTYSQQLTSSGGTSPYTWSLSSGTLPTGLTLSSSGLITGSPVTGSTQNVTVQLVEGHGVTTSQAFTLTVNAPPMILSSTIQGATLTGAYSQQVPFTGGTSPLTWSISAGTLGGGLTLNSSSGLISGSSVSGGNQSFTVKVVDANGVATTQAYSLTVNAAPLLSATSPTTATVGETGYSYGLATNASLGTTPYYSWTVTTGTLPTGLTLNSVSGVISGTVTGGSQTFTVTLLDANHVAATQSYTLTVYAAPAITTPSLNTATDNQTTYSQQLTSSGGTSPYTWSLSSGTLPTGLTLSSSGLITGSPVTGSTQNVTVQLVEGHGVTTSQTFTLTVNGAPSITTVSLPAATDGQTTYSQTIAHTGGTGTLTWSISAGTLGGGLSLSSSGVISGSPVSGGNQSFTVKIVDANGVSTTQAYSLTVNGAPLITTASLPAATDGQTTYSQTIAHTGGTGTLTWSISAGTLGGGLSLSSSGVISGSPVSGGNQSFTVKIIDANGVSTTQAYSLTVNAALVITTASPLTGTHNAAYSTTLAATGGTGTLTWTLTSGTLPGTLTLSTSGVLSGTGGPVGSTNFTVTVTDANGVAVSKPFTITFS